MRNEIEEILMIVRGMLVVSTMVLINASSLGAQAAESAIGIRAPVVANVDSGRPRVASIEYSDAYATRLRIHHIASYAELPLFGAEYLLGDRLMKPNHADWIRPTHIAVAAGLGTLFAVNTVTGVWNLVESRHDPVGRPRRLLHSALMLGADAGFAYTGFVSSRDARRSLDGRQRHKNAALVSIGASTVGTVMMWLWNN